MEVESWSSTATLEALNRQRHEGVLCDVKILVEDGSVLAHQAVLAACSPYFYTMFTGGFIEGASSVAEVNMSGIFPNLGTAEHVIQSMYTARINVEADNACVLHSVYSFLLMNRPLTFGDFMSEDLSLDNCIEYWQATIYRNTTGNLHTKSTRLLKNRFHDHLIYQESLLEVPASTISRIMREEITAFCSSKQILTYPVNWFVKSDLKESNMLRQLLIESHLPEKSDFKKITSDIQRTVTITESTRRVIEDICNELYKEVHDEEADLNKDNPNTKEGPCIEAEKKGEQSVRIGLHETDGESSHHTEKKMDGVKRGLKEMDEVMRGLSLNDTESRSKQPPWKDETRQGKIMFARDMREDKEGHADEASNITAEEYFEKIPEQDQISAHDVNLATGWHAVKFSNMGTELCSSEDVPEKYLWSSGALDHETKESSDKNIRTVEKTLERKYMEDDCGEMEDSLQDSYHICGREALTDFRISANEATGDVLVGHISGDNVQADNVDVLLAIAPGFTDTCIQEDEQAQAMQLRLCGYVIRDRLWVDIGIIGHPTKGDGETISVSKSRLYGAGEKLYLVSETDVFVSRLPWIKWNIVVLPTKGERKRQRYPLRLKNTMYFLLIDEVEAFDEATIKSFYERNISGRSRPLSAECLAMIRSSYEKWNYSRLTLGMMTEDGMWKEILQYEDDKDRGKRFSYGPCWVEEPYFLVHRWKVEHFTAGVKDHDFILFNPEKKGIQLAISDGEPEDWRSFTHSLGTTPLLIEYGNWVYSCKGHQSNYCARADFGLRFRLSDDKSHLLLEKPTESITFVNSICKDVGNCVYVSKLHTEDPSPVIWTTSGPCFWRVGNTKGEQSFLHESNIQHPDVETEHTPPPCNMILAATSLKINSDFLSTRPISHYHQISYHIQEAKYRRLYRQFYD